MKLVHANLEQQMKLDGEQIYEWIIESPKLFSGYVQEICAQSQGGEGRFVLSDGDKEIGISKAVEVIVNPFAVDINDKKY